MVITPTKSTARRKTTTLAQPVNLHATMVNASITLSYATKCPIVLMIPMSLCIAMSTNAPRLKFINADTNALTQ